MCEKADSNMKVKKKKERERESVCCFKWVEDCHWALIYIYVYIYLMMVFCGQRGLVESGFLIRERERERESARL